MISDQSHTPDEAEIRNLIADKDNAICAKNIERIMSHYAPNVVFFDVKPPYQINGIDAFRSIWEACLPYFPDTFSIERRDLKVLVSDDLAAAHWLSRFCCEDKDHPAAQSWMRDSVTYERFEGKWFIVHEHCSMPFDPVTSQALLTLNI